MTLVILGSDAGRLDGNLDHFERAGYRRVAALDEIGEGDHVLGVSDGGAELLKEADRRKITYTLVHEGASDGRAGGTYERAHHRVESNELPELAQHLRSRTRPLVTCLAFGYKNGVPPEAALMVDARFLDNPYWDPDLRELTGRDQEVVDFVMKQKPAQKLLSDLERMVRDLLPLYHEKGRMHLVVAFGCTGGRHRSVVLASEMAGRLRTIEGIDVDLVTRDI